MDLKKTTAYSINNLHNTPLWNLIQQKLNSANLQWEDGQTFSDENRKDVRKSKIAWLSDQYLTEQLFYSIDLCNKQNWARQHNVTWEGVTEPTKDACIEDNVFQ